ncbi:hypothetical protein [Streptomyces scabiei]|uniref:hypothetical protein n=1 Tax=Streptomyces scabiei TaxID=1930 RepID=UPI000A372F78|nr:hypothetical protein [Streptomyces scabiei]
MRCVTGTNEGPQVVADGRTPSYEEVMSTARHGARVVLADETLPRPAHDRAVVEDVVDRRVPAYGHALVAEIRKLSVRVSTGPRHGAAGVEDESTDAAPGARRPTTMLTRLRQVLTVEAVVAAQAVDPAVPAVLGRGPEFLRRSIREVLPRLDDDRPCGVDVETVRRDIPESDDVRSTLRALTGEASALVGGAA